MPARCPGQDQRYWKPEDIFDVGCPYCGHRIEFWKDEPCHRCAECGREVRNPRIDLACAQWCASAEECLGRSVDADGIAAPVVERLMVLLEQRLEGRQDALARARQVCAEVDTLLATARADPRLAKPAALLVGAAWRSGPSERPGEPAPGDGDLLGGGSAAELLMRSGLGDGEARAIAGIVRSVLAGPDRHDAESMLVWEALRLVLRPLEPS